MSQKLAYVAVLVSLGILALEIRAGARLNLSLGFVLLSGILGGIWVAADKLTSECELRRIVPRWLPSIARAQVIVPLTLLSLCWLLISVTPSQLLVKNSGILYAVLLGVVFWTLLHHLASGPLHIVTSRIDWRSSYADSLRGALLMSAASAIPVCFTLLSSGFYGEDGWFSPRTVAFVFYSLLSLSYTYGVLRGSYKLVRFYWKDWLVIFSTAIAFIGLQALTLQAVLSMWVVAVGSWLGVVGMLVTAFQVSGLWITVQKLSQNGGSQHVQLA